MVRRSRLDIYFDILRVINSGTNKPTRIMYKSNMTWKVLQEILELLVNRGFIKEKLLKKNTRYYITEKGKNALSYHLKALDGLVINSNQEHFSFFL